MGTTGGLILCGGKSSRMGRDKAALRFGPETLLERVLGRMRQVAGPVAVSLAAGAAAPALPADVLVTRDAQAEQGPLWGLLEGFRALSGRVEQVLVLPVDMPFLTPDWMRRLVEGLAGQSACLYEWEGFVNALTGAYRLDLLPKLETLVAEGRMRPLFLSQGEPTRVIAVEDHWREGESPPPMMDVDTPEAYRDALLLEGIGDAGGAAVTVEFADPAQAGAAGHPLPLFAATAGQALHWAARLYPEHEPALRRALDNGEVLSIDADGTRRAIGAHTRPAPGARLLVGAGG